MKFLYNVLYSITQQKLRYNGTPEHMCEHCEKCEQQNEQKNEQKDEQKNEQKDEQEECFHCMQVPYIYVPDKPSFIIKRKNDPVHTHVYVYKKQTFVEMLKKNTEVTCYRYYSPKCKKCMQLKEKLNGIESVNDITYTYC
jgi:hypothetical protein